MKKKKKKKKLKPQDLLKYLDNYRKYRILELQKKGGKSWIFCVGIRDKER